MARQIVVLVLLLNVAFIELVSAENDASPASSPRGIAMPSHDHNAIGNTGDEGAPGGGPVGPGDVVEGPIGNEGNTPVAQPPGSSATTRGVFSAAGGAIGLVIVGYFIF